MNSQPLELDFSPPAQRHSATSVASAHAIEPGAETLRGEVLAYLRRRGAMGASDDEMQRELGMNPSTQRPRRIELCRAGLVYDSGTTRKTSSGRHASIWMAA